MLHTKKTNLIYSASAAGLPFFYSHKERALLKGVPFPAILSDKFQK